MALFAIRHTLATVATLLIEATDVYTAEKLAGEFLPGSRYVTATEVKCFATVEEAHADFNAMVEWEDFKDNYRAAFESDLPAFAEYDAAADRGCCGSADVRYMVAGRIYWIGCNYGH